MATARSQTRWRSRNRFTKKQLNVMARVETHEALEAIAAAHALRGKGEAVTFACFVTRWLMQKSAHNREAATLLTLLSDVYHKDRETYSA